jgi:hypothetical protein
MYSVMLWRQKVYCRAVKKTKVRFEVFHGGDYEECRLLGCGAV